MHPQILRLPRDIHESRPNQTLSPSRRSKPPTLVTHAQPPSRYAHFPAHHPHRRNQMQLYRRRWCPMLQRRSCSSPHQMREKHPESACWHPRYCGHHSKSLLPSAYPHANYLNHCPLRYWAYSCHRPNRRAPRCNKPHVDAHPEFYSRFDEQGDTTHYPRSLDSNIYGIVHIVCTAAHSADTAGCVLTTNLTRFRKRIKPGLLDDAKDTGNLAHVFHRPQFELEVQLQRKLAQVTTTRPQADVITSLGQEKSTNPNTSNEHDHQPSQYTVHQFVGFVSKYRRQLRMSSTRNIYKTPKSR